MGGDSSDDDDDDDDDDNDVRVVSDNGRDRPNPLPDASRKRLYEAPSMSDNGRCRGKNEDKDAEDEADEDDDDDDAVNTRPSVSIAILAPNDPLVSLGPPNVVVAENALPSACDAFSMSISNRPRNDPVASNRSISSSVYITTGGRGGRRVGIGMSVGRGSARKCDKVCYRMC